MKKVKLMLVGALVVATVGGALAFKAHKGTQLFCGPINGQCHDDQGEVYRLTTQDFIPNFSCSTVQDGVCTSAALDN